MGYSHLGEEPAAYSERRELCRRVFEEADPDAIAAMARDYGVDYLVVDRVHGRGVFKLDKVAQRVYHEADITIYQIQP
jgi:uncharacterized membrane protein